MNINLCLNWKMIIILFLVLFFITYIISTILRLIFRPESNKLATFTHFMHACGACIIPLTLATGTIILVLKYLYK